MKFCPECGSKINGGKFCSNCGVDLTKYGASNSVAEDINAELTLDDALGNLMNLAEEKRAEEAIARDFEIKDGVLIKYKGDSADVVIPDSVTHIGKDAFKDKNRLESLTIPSSVTTIDYCFVPIDKIKYNGDIKDWCSIKGLNWLMGSDVTLFINGEEVKGDLTIPQGVKIIESGAFMNCKNITSVTISTGVTTICFAAFMDCYSLQSVTLPNSLEQIDYNAFGSCSSLSSLIIPDSVVTIGRWAFSHCRGLISIKLGKSVESIGEYAFYGCREITSITLPKSLKNIEDNAFGEWDKLTAIYYSGDLESWCEISGLENLTAHGRTLYINGKGISGEFRIPYGIKRICANAFCGCSEWLESVIIPDSVKRIGDWAFGNCVNLGRASIPYDCGYESNSFPSWCKVITR